MCGCVGVYLGLWFGLIRKHQWKRSPNPPSLSFSSKTLWHWGKGWPSILRPRELLLPAVVHGWSMTEDQGRLDRTVSGSQNKTNFLLREPESTDPQEALSLQTLGPSPWEFKFSDRLTSFLDLQDSQTPLLSSLRFGVSYSDVSVDLPFRTG